MRRSSKSLIFLLTGLSSQVAISGSMGNETSSTYNYVASLSAGPVWQNGGATQSFYLIPEIEKTYVANKSTTALADVELFLGMQKTLNNTFQGQLGLTGAITSSTSLNGNIWDDALPEFNNFTYSYKVQHAHIALKGKILAEAGFLVTPWVSGSLGIGFNRASDFTSTPTIFEAVQTPNFTSRTQTAFTYTLGAGIQKALSQHWQAGIGYEFADWGKSALGRAAEQTLNSGITLNHFYTNGFLLNISYLT